MGRNEHFLFLVIVLYMPEMQMALINAPLMDVPTQPPISPAQPSQCCCQFASGHAI